MNHYSFIAASNVDLMSLNDVRHRENIAEPVQLGSLGELSILVTLLDSGLTIPASVNMEDVKEIWTVTGPLCHFNDKEFDVIYREWIAESSRADTPEEQEQLARLNAFIPEFNHAQHKLIALIPDTLNS